MSSPSQIKDNIYATLPRSLKSELAVTTKIQDPEVVQERREMVSKKSVNELSQVTQLSDLPIPTPIQKMIDTAQHIKDPKPEGYVAIYNIFIVGLKKINHEIFVTLSYFMIYLIQG